MYTTTLFGVHMYTPIFKKYKSIRTHGRHMELLWSYVAA